MNAYRNSILKQVTKPVAISNFKNQKKELKEFEHLVGLFTSNGICVI